MPTVVLVCLGILVLVFNIIMYVDLPNGHLTSLGYRSIIALAILFNLLYWWIKWKFFREEKSEEKKPDPLIWLVVPKIFAVLFLSVVSYAVSYGSLGYGLILYAYFYGAHTQTKSLNVVRIKYRAAGSKKYHAGWQSAVNVSGYYVYFEGGGIYSNSYFQDVKFMEWIRRHIHYKRIHDEVVITDRSASSDSFLNSATVYCRTSPFAVVVTAISGADGRRIPATLFSVANYYNYPV